MNFKVALLLGCCAVTPLCSASIADIEREHEVPDYSYVGYHRSERSIPHVEGPIFDITDFGAEANDDRPDREAIEAAVAAAAAQGGGVVYIPAGRFDLSAVSDAAPLVIRHSRIVLRGAGADLSELHLSEALPPPPPMRLWASPYAVQFAAPSRSAEPVALTQPASRGDSKIEVAAVGSLQAGDWIILSLKNTDQAFRERELAGFAVIDPRWTRIIKEGVQVSARHQISAIEGTTIQLTAPVLKAMQPTDGWQVVPWYPIEEVGVEHLTLSGDWQERFVHHRSWVDDGGYSLLQFSNVVNSWIRDCRFVDVSRAASIAGSAHITVLDSEILGTPGHSAIYLSGSTRCLLARVSDLAGQHHSLGVAARSIGNVIWRSYWESHTSFESHASQPRHTLFDSCIGGIMKGRAGGALGALPNHLEGLILWNHHKTNQALTDFPFEDLAATHWRFLQPLIVGMHGTPIDFREGQSKVLLLGEPIAAGSLFETQAMRRLGVMPADLR